MSFFRFLLGEGSSIVFSALLVAFVYTTPTDGWIQHNMFGLFVITLGCLAYLGMQMSLAAFARVGQDKPLLDLFFSIVPLFALFGIVLLAAVDQVSLAAFHVYALIIAGIVVVMDVIFNSQVVFKMNRLATDMVQMR